VDDRDLLRRTRAQLLADLERVPEAAVSFQPVAGARTIAESLLHVAAVELVFAVALARRGGHRVPAELWEPVKRGLAAEARYDPPRDTSLATCLVHLRRTRAALETVCPAGQTVLGDEDLHGALLDLHAAGVDLDEDRVELLRGRIGSHLNEAPVGVVLTAHEEYHRGQILYQNFLARHAAGAIA
jgi:hypothetical protein